MAKGYNSLGVITVKGKRTAIYRIACLFLVIALCLFLCMYVANSVPIHSSAGLSNVHEQAMTAKEFKAATSAWIQSTVITIATLGQRFFVTCFVGALILLLLSYAKWGYVPTKCLHWSTKTMLGAAVCLALLTISLPVGYKMSALTVDLTVNTRWGWLLLCIFFGLSGSVQAGKILCDVTRKKRQGISRKSSGI